MRYVETELDLKLLAWLMIQIVIAAAFIALLAYGCAQVAGLEWLNPFRAFGITCGAFVLTLLVRACAWVYGSNVRSY